MCRFQRNQTQNPLAASVPAHAPVFHTTACAFFATTHSMPVFLHEAIKEGNEKVAAYLVDNGASVNDTDDPSACNF